MGARLSLWKVAMKPCHPIVFGKLQGIWIWGLPGNPVSSMVTFEEFVRPALLKMIGTKEIFRPVIRAVLRERIEKSDHKMHFIRARVREEEGRYTVCPTGEQSSGMLSSMVKANGLIVISEETQELLAGATVKVQLLEKGLRGQSVPGF